MRGFILIRLIITLLLATRQVSGASCSDAWYNSLAFSGRGGFNYATYATECNQCVDQRNCGSQINGEFLTSYRDCLIRKNKNWSNLDIIFRDNNMYELCNIIVTTSASGESVSFTSFSKNTTPIGLIVGCSIGGVVLIALIIVGSFYFVKKQRQIAERKKEEEIKKQKKEAAKYSDAPTKRAAVDLYAIPDA